MWVTERQELFENESQTSIMSTDKLVASGSSKAVSWQIIQSSNQDCQGKSAEMFSAANYFLCKYLKS